MKKTFFSILCLGFSMFSYSQDIILPQGNLIRRHLGDEFTYQNRPMCFYGIGWQPDSWNMAGNSLWISAFGGIKFFTENGYSMGINSKGNVGIGTDNPGYKLDVKGDIGIQNVVIPVNKQIIRNPSDVFKYQDISFGHYALGWMTDPWDNQGPTLWQSSYSGVKFFTRGLFRMCINASGNVGIGISSPQNKLDVNGTIRATEVKVEAGWADFVFDKDYKLPTLQEVENHINEHKHLPDIPSEAEVKENGVSLGEMQAKLLQKIEELTLYVIKQDKTIKEQGEKMNKQAELIKDLQGKLE